MLAYRLQQNFLLMSACTGHRKVFTNVDLLISTQDLTYARNNKLCRNGHQMTLVLHVINVSVPAITQLLTQVSVPAIIQRPRVYEVIFT